MTVCGDGSVVTVCIHHGNAFVCHLEMAVCVFVFKRVFQINIRISFMVKKSRVVLLVAVVLLLSTQNLSALDSANIERVRESVGTGKLSSSDLNVLDDFVSKGWLNKRNIHPSRDLYSLNKKRLKKIKDCLQTLGGGKDT